MHAVIVTGGQQFRVEQGQVLDIEKLEVEMGQTVTFDKILLISDGETSQIGQPYVEGATVKADIVKHKRDDKIDIIKFRRRKHSKTQAGHRQWKTVIKITDIVAK